jgi:glyoxylase-like metal-dependent hydrolase (beta-lactamase superfamily II)
MALISEAAERIYEIKPEGKELENFPLCTVYLILDDNTALVEVGCSIQVPDILEAVGKLGYDIRKLSYIIPTHVHIDHAGGAAKIMRMFADNVRQCADIALNALKAGADREEIVNSLADVLVKGSTLTREDYLASSPYFRTLMIEGCRQYFEKKNMV